MPDASFLPIFIIFALAIAFAITNGFNDAANAIATVISTRVLSPSVAIVMAAFLNFAGAATGTAVARFIATGILDVEVLTTGELTKIVIAALAAVTIWTVFATRYGLPVSLSHGLIAGFVGAGIATAGSGVIIWSGPQKVLLAVVSTPILGFTAGFAIMIALLWLFRRSAPAKVGGIFGKLQILSAAFMAYAHGKNDGQMPMSFMALALMLHYGWAEFYIPFWVMVLSASAIALGTAIGGWRVIRTLGLGITALRPVHGFAAETSAATVVEVASHLGIPVSTTHCISSSIMGVGATRRLSAVRWGVAGDIVTAWIITFPICAGLGWLLAHLLVAIW